MAAASGETVEDISEIPHPERRRTSSFYIVLFFVVLPLWSVIPLSWFFVTYTLHTGLLSSFKWRGRALFVAALCEVFFSIHHHRLVRHISGPSPIGPGNLAEVQAAFTRVLKSGLANLPEDGFDEESLDVDRPGSPAESIVALQSDDARAIDFRNCMRTWFQKAPWSAIRTQEVYAWLYWDIFNTALPPLESIPRAHRAALDEALDLLQKRSGSIISPGSNTAVSPILLTLDKVNVKWRPLFWYILVTSMNWILKKWLERSYCARFGSYNGLDYCVRVPKTWDPVTGPRPILFLHGLGLGLTQYKIFITHLLHTLPDRPILVPLQPHISQEFFHPQFLKPLNRYEATACLAGLMRELGWVPRKDNYSTDSESEVETPTSLTTSARTGVVVLSHSNGSYVHAWLLKAHPEMAVRSCFVDPVTFCSWEGDVCYNFLYSRCATGLELIMRYFVGTELGVANTIQRHFDWTSNSLWYEEIPNARDPQKTMFVLGGNDAIVKAERVHRYLSSHGVRKGLHLDPDGIHGQALITGGPMHNEILQWLQDS
ncbi:hypothetical protein BJ138DRAFT_1123730 [Hygrophoropsis aurantiaca]|uniref:Uncharacterized protein n=1 Tax=Hygrophoropsis aurantiaca TaxID=72124 RepID=A0ACB8AKZ4_9AGAM|nr:hypothetical protein BJ138DRAFT_1123730 [Hygrophoropsis aurantiaca]